MANHPCGSVSILVKVLSLLRKMITKMLKW